MMVRVLCMPGFITMLLSYQVGQAQAHKPVSWHSMATAVKGSEKQLTFTASLEKGWHIYSQFIDEGGALPTTFTFAGSNAYTLIDNVKEVSTPVKGYDQTFRMNVTWFAQTAVFIQQVKLHVPSASVKGKIEYMVCMGDMCLPPDIIEFSIDLVRE